MNLFKSDPLSMAAMLRGIAIQLESGAQWTCTEYEDRKIRLKVFTAHSRLDRTTYSVSQQTGSPVLKMAGQDPDPKYFMNTCDILDIETGCLWYLGTQEGSPHWILYDDDRYFSVPYDPDNIDFIPVENPKK